MRGGTVPLSIMDGFGNILIPTTEQLIECIDELCSPKEPVYINFHHVDGSLTGPIEADGNWLKTASLKAVVFSVLGDDIRPPIDAIHFCDDVLDSET